MTLDIIGVLFGVEARFGNGVNCFVGVLCWALVAFLSGVVEFEVDLGVVDCLSVWPLLRPERRGMRARLGLPVSEAIDVATWLKADDGLVGEGAGRGAS